VLSAAVVKLKFTLIPVFWLFKDKMKANIVDIHCENKPLKAQSFHAEEGGQSRSQHGQEDGAGKNRSFAEVLLPPLHHPSLRDYEMHSLTSLPTSVSFNSSGP